MGLKILYKPTIVFHDHCPVELPTAYSHPSLPKMKVAFVLIGMVSVVFGTQSYGYQDYNTYAKDTYYPSPYYSFGYSVKDPYTYNDYGHEETRNGDNTKGQYQVLLPDGRRQIVTYYVDGNSGFVADVKFVGETKYPPNPKPQPYIAGPYRQY